MNLESLDEVVMCIHDGAPTVCMVYLHSAAPDYLYLLHVFYWLIGLDLASIYTQDEFLNDTEVTKSINGSLLEFPSINRSPVLKDLKYLPSSTLN